MADSKITALTEDTSPATGDLVVTVDISDTSMSANGTDKKVTLANIAKSFSGAAKFWAQITGAGSPAITTSFNTGSVTDVATGDMRLTYTTAFASANYCVMVTGVSTGSTVTLATMQWVDLVLAASVEVQSADLSATPAVEDPAVGYNLVGFGAQ